MRRNAPDPVPLLLLGQLAIDTGRGLGELLLRDAMLRVANLWQHVGFRAMAAHPLDDDAAQFYRRFGFTLVPDTQPALMLLPMQKLLEAIRVARE